MGDSTASGRAETLKPDAERRGTRGTLHEQNPTGRFSGRASDYRKYRPSYPSAAIDSILAGLGDPAGLVAADIGAGTGISSRLMADRGAGTIAVEPNAAMRAVAEAHPRIEWREGTAERTGLSERSVDLVLCAQAFHWFRAPESIAEFARVLRPGGRLALMWNIRDERDAFTREYGSAVIRASSGDAAAEKAPEDGGLSRSPMFTGARHEVYPSSQRLDWHGVLGRATSSSYVPREGAAYERMVKELRAAWESARDQDGCVEMVYRTEVFLADRAG